MVLAHLTGGKAEGLTYDMTLTRLYEVLAAESVGGTAPHPRLLSTVPVLLSPCARALIKSHAHVLPRAGAK